MSESAPKSGDVYILTIPFQHLANMHVLARATDIQTRYNGDLEWETRCDFSEWSVPFMDSLKEMGIIFEKVEPEDISEPVAGWSTGLYYG